MRFPPWIAVLACLIVLTPAVGASPTEVPERFLVRGEGELVVEGATVPVTDFAAELLVRSDGSVELARLTATPMGGIFRVSWFGGGEEVPFYCPRAATYGPVPGRVDSFGNLWFPPGARMVVQALDEHGPFRGGCPGSGDRSRFTVTTDRPLNGRHDPRGDTFRLEGSFLTRVEGHDVHVDLRLLGRYVNRPPRAAIGIAGPGIPEWMVQGACPALTGVNPPGTEANDPDGLRLTLLSASDDPDGDLGRSDLALEQWFHWQGGAPGAPGTTFEVLGRGRAQRDLLFEIGPLHTVVLSTFDHSGAEDRAFCQFRVIETTPPVVTPPPPLEIRCADIRGITPAESSRLRDFLAGGSATDATDPAPTRLPAVVAGREVTPTTRFPIGTTPVSFRFRDRHNNTGHAVSTVRVTARLLADLRIDFDGVPRFDPSGRWYRAVPRLSFVDICGSPIRFRLLSVISAEGIDLLEQQLVRPEKDVSAGFELQLPKGAAGVYKVKYLAVDAAGKQREIVSKLVVAPKKSD